MSEDKTIDPEKILGIYTYAPYDMHYWVYDKDIVKPGKDILKAVQREKGKLALENSNHNCFADFAYLYRDFIKKNKKIPNRFLYLVKLDKHSKVNVTEEEIVRWVSICKKHNFMPSRVGPLFLKKKYFIIDLSEINVQQLYFYLVSARYLQEEPYFIKTVFNLIDDGFDFYVALVVATRCTTANSGHNLLPFYKGYGPGTRSSDPNAMTFNLNYARKIRIFANRTIKTCVKNLEEVKDIHLTAAESGRSSYEGISFNLHKHLEEAANNIVNLSNVKAKDLKEDKILKEIYSGE